MELKIAVVDDREQDLDLVASMTEEYLRSSKSVTPVISKFSGGNAFFQSFTKGAFHAVFPDICMDEMTGIELSRRLRTLDGDIAIIFMSTTTEYVFETFKATPFGYLIKPFTFEQFSEEMKKTVDHFSSVKKSLSVKIPRSVLSVDLDSIFSVASNGHNTIVQLSSGQALKSIDKFQYFKNELLEEGIFIECNRGIIINMDYVLTIQNNEIVMLGGTTYPLRTRYKKDLVSHITKYISQKMKGELYI